MADKKQDWKKINRDMEVRPGEKPGWFEVKMNNKKFIMKEVRQFYSEKDAASVDQL